MNNKSEENNTITPEDYLVSALFDFYRSPKTTHNFLHAAKLAQSILARNTPLKSGILEKRFLFFASKLKNNVNAATLREFADKCLLAATKTGACTTFPDPQNQGLTIKRLKKYAKEDLAVSLRLGHSEGAAVNRAAYELIRKQKEERAKHRLAENIRTHPLKETLEGLMVKEGRLAKEDIRNQLLRLARPSSRLNAHEGVLFTLLAKAQAFSAPRLHRLLGDDLFFLCRPSGFLDQKGTTVVVEVPTSAHLHALTYRKLEILQALKNDNAFLLVNKIHFKVRLS